MAEGFAEKGWGSYEVLDIGADSLTVKVTLNPGHGMSYHSHERRSEVWTVVSDTGHVVIDGFESVVAAGPGHLIIYGVERVVLSGM